jgi:D-alanyl-D-alanine carboxypeptidase
VTWQGHGGGYPGSLTLWYYLPEQDTYLTINLNSADMSTDNLQTIRMALLTYLKNGTYE